MAEYAAPGEPDAPENKPSRRRDARLVVGGAVAVLLVWFALVNRQRVGIHFWVVTANAPVVVVVAISGVFGAVLALVLRRSTGRRHRSS
jgi:uncharacterized integral membrane protein